MFQKSPTGRTPSKIQGGARKRNRRKAEPKADDIMQAEEQPEPGPPQKKQKVDAFKMMMMKKWKILSYSIDLWVTNIIMSHKI